MYRQLLFELESLSSESASASSTVSSPDVGQHCREHCACAEIRELKKQEQEQSSKMPTTSPTSMNNNVPSVLNNNSSPLSPEIKEKPQRRISGVLSRIGERSSSATPEENVAFLEMQRISPPAREIIKRTFALMEKDAIKNALHILISLFSEHPRYKNIWPQFRAIPDSSLMNAVELRRHGSVYMTGLRTIIDAMDDDSHLAEQLKRIARAHIKWNIHKTHIMHMLVPVLEVVRMTSGVKELDEATRDAWTTLYDVIANLVYDFSERERRASLSQSAMSPPPATPIHH